MSNQYSLTVTNDSSFSGDLCVYQRNPHLDDPTVMSLAWFTKYIYPTTTVTFNWSIDYSFIWGYTGALRRGVVFAAAQTWPANLDLSNQVTLTYDSTNDAFTFKDQTQNMQGGSLFILQDATIPSNSASVGIAMSGSGAYACQARPNWQFIFTPHPTYWLTFGTYSQGQVLDITSIPNGQEIQFPTNVFSMNATLKKDNTWSVHPG